MELIKYTVETFSRKPEYYRGCIPEPWEGRAWPAFHPPSTLEWVGLCGADELAGFYIPFENATPIPAPQGLSDLEDVRYTQWYIVGIQQVEIQDDKYRIKIKSVAQSRRKAKPYYEELIDGIWRVVV